MRDHDEGHDEQLGFQAQWKPLRILGQEVNRSDLYF